MLTEEQWKSWREDGYVLLKGFFDAGRVDAVNAAVDALWRTRGAAGEIVADIFIDTPHERRIRFREAPDDARDVPYKLNNLYLELPVVRDLVLDKQLAGILAELLEGKPIVCNTLNLERGSQQRDHFDTFYMPPLVENKMLATWIALEPVTEDSGPLRYYPGSHRIPPYRFSHGRLNAIGAEMPEFDRYIAPRIQERGLTPVRFMADPGDVFIWHAQLYHGGDPIRDPRATRRSLVTHYFRARDYVLRRGWQFRRAGGGWWMKRPHDPVPGERRPS